MVLETGYFPINSGYAFFISFSSLYTLIPHKLIITQKNVDLSDSEMDDILQSHLVAAKFLRNDDYEGFIKDRSEKLSRLIEKAMGKEVSESEEIA